ncbi:hypothetical membrane protein (DUF204 domain) [Campylobacter iguaniorum]|uniref:Putative manganese efflux pump MntP n=1 Tax=Campylobacter iguaniorum TaxID=1244531 RepID=A0A076FDG8_9BACT|nr:manganese efflux pump MntP family protein [Campylobacter iguaniorum]AII15427.1 hypothetical membrane protein (DUF204 domain) [Campylobacter iguaniorum]ALV25357.1 hypothetical membrane protein (DUF204 domain) [Campylobacter iguaniorum]
MEIIFLAIALAMDSVALSMANGARCKNLNLADVLKMSFIFGLAQAIMPAVGYVFGLAFVKFIASIDHFIAFVILTFLGAKMIKESKDMDPKCSLNLNLRMLMLGAIATSIDALAVGVTLSFGDANIYEACLIIGAVCFILCVAASFVGRVLGDMLESKAMILGGVILIALGVKILAEHLGVLQLLGL